MKIKNSLSVVLLLGIFISHVAFAQVQFQPRAFIGVSDYELTPTEGLSSAAKLSDGDLGIGDTMAVVGLGATLILDSWFFDTYIQQTDKGSFSGSDFAIDDGQSFFSSTEQRGEIDHSDIAVAVGRAFDSGVSLSLGYKFGETEINESAVDSFREYPEDPISTQDFSGKQIFKNEGPFVSLGYGRALGNGVIAANVAVADLDADYFVEDEVTMGDEGEGSDDSFSGNATGVSLGAFWKASLTEHINYKVSIDYYRYDFDFGENDEAREEATTIKFEISMPLKMTYP